MADTIFQFKILNGDDPQAQYDAIVTKDPMTFYLLSTGIGYFGEVPLFGGGANRTVVMVSDILTEPEPGKLYILNNVTYGVNTLTGLYFYDGVNMACFSDDLIAAYLRNIIVTDMLADDYTGDNNTLATTKAVMDLVNQKLETAVVLRDVKSHTLTEADLYDPRITVPEGCHAGDTGLFGDMKDIIGSIYKPDVVLVSIGDKFTMGPFEAALATMWMNPTAATATLRRPAGCCLCWQSSTA